MCAGKPNTQPLALSADPFDKGNTLSNVAPRSGMKTRMKIRSLGGVARDAGVGPPSHTTQPEGLTGPRPCQEGILVIFFLTSQRDPRRCVCAPMKSQ